MSGRRKSARKKSAIATVEQDYVRCYYAVRTTSAVRARFSGGVVPRPTAPGEGAYAVPQEAWCAGQCGCGVPVAVGLQWRRGFFLLWARLPVPLLFCVPRAL